MAVAAVLKQKGSDVIAVRPDTLVAEAAETIARRRIGAVVVLSEDGKLVGILSERDLVRGLVEHGAGLLQLTVRELMTADVKVATLETSVREAMEIMDAGYFRHLPVVDAQGTMRGIVSIRDLVRYRITTQESDVESLQAYVIGRGYALGRVA